MKRGREEKKGEVKRGSCKGEKEEERSGKRRTGRRREGGGRVCKDGERKHLSVVCHGNHHTCSHTQSGLTCSVGSQNVMIPP